ncbi:transposase [Streptomyces sp. NPDC088847]|uniref:transposase n=1 Tax=Streptomyces sp. NPDC088847 TaxID=3365909 RepID=UPI00381B40E7
MHYGDLVRVALMEARPAGLQSRQLAAATRLTPSQVARGVRHLRDVGAAEHLTPIIWRPRDGYLFSDEPAEWIEYEKKQFQLVLGRLTRLITGTLDPTWHATLTTNGPARLRTAHRRPRHPPSSPSRPRRSFLMPSNTRRRRYPSDTTVSEWALIEPLLPQPACQTKTGGWPEK